MKKKELELKEREIALKEQNAKFYQKQTQLTINEKKKENTVIQVYPVPANDKVSIDLKRLNNDGQVLVSIFNIMGSAVYTNQINTGSQKNIDVNTSSFPEGIYLVKAESDTKISSQKIVIQR